jgi:hypothetical protein
VALHGRRIEVEIVKIAVEKLLVTMGACWETRVKCRRETGGWVGSFLENHSRQAQKIAGVEEPNVWEGVLTTGGVGRAGRPAGE